MKTRILLFISEDWVFVSHRLHLACFASQEGYDVFVACNETKHRKLIEDSGIKLINWNIDRGSQNIFVLLRDIQKTFKIIRSVKPKIVQPVALKPILLVGLASIFTRKIRLIFCLTGMGSLYTSEKLIFQIKQKLLSVLLTLIFYKKSGKVVVQNSDDFQFLMEKKIARKKQLHLIKGAGVDISHFKPREESPDKPIVALPARMLMDKGVIEFVEVAKIVNKHKKIALFYLFGKPDLANPNSLSEEQLASWQCEGHVSWQGHSDDIRSTMQNCHIICYPSYREGLPKVLLEASACGKPIVAFNVQGCREIVHEGVNGYLVPFGRVDEMAKSVSFLINSPETRRKFGRAGRNIIKAEYRNELIQKQFLALWD